MKGIIYVQCPRQLTRFWSNEGNKNEVLITIMGCKTDLCCLIPQTCSSRVRNKRRDDGAQVVVFVINLLSSTMVKLFQNPSENGFWRSYGPTKQVHTLRYVHSRVCTRFCHVLGSVQTSIFNSVQKRACAKSVAFLVRGNVTLVRGKLGTIGLHIRGTKGLHIRFSQFTLHIKCVPGQFLNSH